MKKLLFLFVLPLLLAASCNKEEPENPLDNVVRCKINGVPWKSQCEGNIVFGCEAVSCIFKEDTNDLILMDLIARNSSAGYFYFILRNIHKNDTTFTSLNMAPFYYTDKGKYYLDTTKSRKFSFTEIDSTKGSDRLGSLNGAFYFTLYNSSGDTLKVTDGYFKTGYSF
jgi:hypothetical protein